MATHYSSGDLLDRDTFMAYGPFHPTRLAISQQLEDAMQEAEMAADEAENEAYEKGRRDRNSLADELQKEVERLEQQLSSAPKPADLWTLRNALDWIAKGNTTKAQMVGVAERALAECAKRKQEAVKAA